MPEGRAADATAPEAARARRRSWPAGAAWNGLFAPPGGRSATGRGGVVAALLLYAALLLPRTSALASGTLEPVPEAPPAPTLRLPEMDGTMHGLAEHAGTVMLVNFWASWCPPCLKEVPSLERLRARLSGRGFEVLAVNVGESPRRARITLDRLGYTGKLLLDREQAAFASWGVEVLPTSFVVGPAGRVRLRAVGDLEWDAEGVVQAIEALLEAPADGG
jgi:thiol-disulfide isomerase/thioredoxin